MMGITVDTQNTEQTDSSSIMSLSFIRNIPSSNDGRKTEFPDFWFFGVSSDRFRYIMVNLGYTAALINPFKFVIY
jgi:hypothetical protein